MSELTHLDASGRARMVDVTEKAATVRSATAAGAVYLEDATLDRIVAGTMAKGEVLVVARVAGIQAAKRTSEIIPLCHPIPLTAVEVGLEPARAPARIEIRVTARSTGPTGVEMEALTAATAAALTLYDMCKAVDRGMRLGPFRLIAKSGGRSGDWTLADGASPGDVPAER